MNEQNHNTVADLENGETPEHAPDLDAPPLPAAVDGVRITLTGNRFAQMFESVVFQLEQRDRVYTTPGRASRRVAAVSVIHRGGFAASPGNVYAVKEGNRKPYLEFSFVGNRNAQAIIPLDAEAKAEFTAWKRAVADRAKAWIKAQGTSLTARANDETIDASDLGLSFD